MRALSEAYAHSAQAVATAIVDRCVNALEKPNAAGKHDARPADASHDKKDAPQPWPHAGPMALVALSVGMAKTGMLSPPLQATLMGSLLAYGVVILPVLMSDPTVFFKSIYGAQKRA